MKCQRRHVRAEHDLIRRRIQKIAKRITRIRNRLVGLGARRIIPFSVGVVMIQIVDHRFADASRNLRTEGKSPDQVFVVGNVMIDSLRASSIIVSSRASRKCRPA